ncbi:MAG TPA: hypothetical protein ENI23_10635 [bacterium]|nr:hypothetical protein [bacterium]
MEAQIQGTDTQNQRFKSEEAAVAGPPELDLNVDDQKLSDFINAYVKQAKNFFDKEKNYKVRRETNERFFFGRQFDNSDKFIYKGIHGERAIRSYEKPFLDNVIKEGEDILRPLILSKLPDFIAKPVDSNSDQSTANADRITKIINKKMSSRELKKVLTKATRHHPIYFHGVIKYRWDPNKGRFGDFVFEAIHPKNILVDHTATINNEKAMKIIVHYVEKSLKEWILRFPKKEQVLIDYAISQGKFKGDLTEEAMACKLKVSEVWFDWFEKGEDFDPEEPKFEFKNGVVWKIGTKADGVLDKRLNPNWDWDGEENLFFNGQPIPQEAIGRLALLGFDIPGIERKKTFKNFFGKPRKPFIFMGYEQYGEQPLDETSRIEENLYIQQNYDFRGMQVTKMIDDAKGKHAFSSVSGLKRETVEEMDLEDPDEDIFIDGKLSDAHQFISKEQPSPQMFQDLANSRDRMLSRVHVHGATRGEIETSVATTNQISRESDFNVADDISADTIDEVSSQMAEAMVHMMKLRYTLEHFQVVLGDEGEETQDALQKDMIEDGLELDIESSTSDKLKAERQAKEESQLQLIDPLNYYKDTGRSDPEKRAEMIFVFNENPALYFKKFIRGDDVPDIAEQVAFANQQKLQAVGGQLPNQNPLAPSAANTSNIPTTPQGSPRGLVQRAGAAIGGLFGK